MTDAQFFVPLSEDEAAAFRALHTMIHTEEELEWERDYYRGQIELLMEARWT